MRSKFLDIKDNLSLWDEAIDIYDKSFPKWEKEEISSIYENVKNQTYKMIVYMQDDEVKGLYILDLYGDKHILLSFLVVKDECRGEGIGSELCKHGIEYFLTLKNAKWLFIEAEYRQSQLYKKLGFRVLNLEYAIPAYDSKDSVKMSLMVIQKDVKLTQNILKDIIQKMFVSGYGLGKDDERIKAQLDKIPNKIEVIKC